MSHAHNPTLSKHAARMRTAFAVAQQRAARAVSSWAIDDGSAQEERTDDIGAVYDAILKGRSDPAQKLTATLEARLSDTVGELMATAEDAGYLYGLAVGLALKTGGAR